MRNLMKKIRKSKKGFTLVEVIVTFALTGILLASAAAVLGVFMNSFVRIRSMSEMETAAHTIMETIISELKSAAGGETIPEERTAFVLAEDGSVWYRNYEGGIAHMRINEEGRLLLEYYTEGDLISGKEPEDTWQYPEGFYGNCEIQKLEINRIEGKNLLEVVLELQHGPGKTTYSVTRMLECYNLEADELG